MSAAEHWDQVKELFGAAIEMAPEQRDSFLRATCVDGSVFGEVRRLIELEQNACEFLSPAATRLDVSPEPFAMGQVVGGRYRIDRQIGDGGMSGGVYRAFDLLLKTSVALKATADLREFFCARGVDHPSVCRVFDYGVDGAVSFFTMELVSGTTLEAYLAARYRLPNRRWAKLAAQLCAGLAAIHEAGLIHGDLTAANVLLTPAGRAVIIDFGLAWFVEDSDGRRAPRQSAGTIAYMAPEILMGEAPSARSDLYSLGVVLYEAATGEFPYEELTPVEDPVQQCLETDPACRPDSVAAVGERIAQLR